MSRSWDSKLVIPSLSVIIMCGINRHKHGALNVVEFLVYMQRVSHAIPCHPIQPTNPDRPNATRSHVPFPNAFYLPNSNPMNKCMHIWIRPATSDLIISTPLPHSQSLDAITLVPWPLPRAKTGSASESHHGAPLHDFGFAVQLTAEQ